MKACSGKCEGHTCPTCGATWRVSMPYCRSATRKPCRDCDNKDLARLKAQRRAEDQCETTAA